MVSPVLSNKPSGISYPGAGISVKFPVRNNNVAVLSTTMISMVAVDSTKSAVRNSKVAIRNCKRMKGIPQHDEIHEPQRSSRPSPPSG
jgi:hypothetical protein